LIDSKANFSIIPAKNQRNFAKGNVITVNGGLEQLAIDGIVEKSDFENLLYITPEIECSNLKGEIAKN